MKKLSLVVSGLILGLTITGGAITNVQAAQAAVPYESYSGVPDITKRFDEMDFLTSSEKNKLEEAQKKNSPHYSEVAKLEKELRKISDHIMKDAEWLIEESNSIYFKNMNLWNKVYSDIPDNTYDKLPSYTEQLNLTKSLTSEEKRQLKNDAARMDEIEGQIQVFYDKVKVATKDINTKIDSEYKKINEVDALNQDIWNKIANNMDGK